MDSTPLSLLSSILRVLRNGLTSKIQGDRGSYGARAADHEVLLPFEVAQSAISMFGFTAKIASDACTAVSLLAVGLDVHSVLFKNCGD
jgi:hypothetical protein